ncbi:probable ATP-dependent RNA helicase DDX27 [Oncorhynchus tshawytscha]|uniref:probable ATP-dependent RNA helicase DDX27 n=1 Tax=Oncorhynchus tshawytscha TaxID=74940 RepID=UPI001C3C9D52|nr:probable ATP-dependent RNA helicase DDX27 [Oncorhynchus tshawytscha]
MCVSCLCVFCVCFLCLCLYFSALLTQAFQDQLMVFTQTKKQAHRMHILLGLMGLKVGELHGNLSQTQKTEEPQVINFTMPNTMKHYIHRVGHTARTCKVGRSVSMVGETERKMLKDIVRKAKTPVNSRVLAQEVISKFRDLIEKLEKDVYASGAWRERRGPWPTRRLRSVWHRSS